MRKVSVTLSDSDLNSLIELAENIDKSTNPELTGRQIHELLREREDMFSAISFGMLASVHAHHPYLFNQ